MPEPPPPRAPLSAAAVAALHARQPGITEELLARLDDGGGATPYGWLVDGLGEARMVLDLACGSAPLADQLTDIGYLGVDRSEAELRRARRDRPDVAVVRGDAVALPVAGPFAAVAVSMALMLLTPLEAVLAEIARVLAPGGRLVATVPALLAPDDEDAELHAAALACLGRAGVGYPVPLDAGELTAALAAHALVVESIDTRRFVMAIHGPDDAQLLARSYYALDDGDAALAAAAAVILDRADGAAGYGISRIIARRVRRSGGGRATHPGAEPRGAEPRR